MLNQMKFGNSLSFHWAVFHNFFCGGHHRKLFGLNGQQYQIFQKICENLEWSIVFIRSNRVKNWKFLSTKHWLTSCQSNEFKKNWRKMCRCWPKKPSTFFIDPGGKIDSKIYSSLIKISIIWVDGFQPNYPLFLCSKSDQWLKQLFNQTIHPIQLWEICVNICIGLMDFFGEKWMCTHWESQSWKKIIRVVTKISMKIWNFFCQQK